MGGVNEEKFQTVICPVIWSRSILKIIFVLKKIHSTDVFKILGLMVKNDYQQQQQLKRPIKNSSVGHEHQSISAVVVSIKFLVAMIFK